MSSPGIVPRSGGYKNAPPKLSKVELAHLTGALKAGSNEAGAAATINRSGRWLRYQKEAHPAVREAVLEAQAYAISQVHRSLHAVATKPLTSSDPRDARAAVPAAIFILKNRDGWADKTQIASTIEVQHLPQIVELSMSPEIMDKVLQRIGEQRERLGLPPAPKTITVPAQVPQEGP